MDYIAELQAAEALENLQRNLIGGYSRFVNSSFIDGHRLTGNWSNGPLLTEPPKYGALKPLPAIRFGNQH